MYPTHPVFVLTSTAFMKPVNMSISSEAHTAACADKYDGRLVFLSSALVSVEFPVEEALARLLDQDERRLT